MTKEKWYEQANEIAQKIMNDETVKDDATGITIEFIPETACYFGGMISIYNPHVDSTLLFEPDEIKEAIMEYFMMVVNNTHHPQIVSKRRPIKSV